MLFNSIDHFGPSINFMFEACIIVQIMSVVNFDTFWKDFKFAIKTNHFNRGIVDGTGMPSFEQIAEGIIFKKL